MSKNTAYFWARDEKMSSLHYCCIPHVGKVYAFRYEAENNNINYALECPNKNGSGFFFIFSGDGTLIRGKYDESTKELLKANKNMFEWQAVNGFPPTQGVRHVLDKGLVALMIKKPRAKNKLFFKNGVRTNRNEDDE